MGDCYRPGLSVDIAGTNAAQLDKLAASAPPIPEWFKPGNRDGYAPTFWENVEDWAETSSVERVLQWPYWYAREVLARREKEQDHA